MPFNVGPFELLIIFIIVLLYFMPTFVAVRRNHPNRTAIFLLNFLLGCVFVGWVAALVWAFTNPSPPPPQQE